MSVFVIEMTSISHAARQLISIHQNDNRVQCSRACSNSVIGLLKQKSSLFVVRSLENQILYSFLFHCYNQPLTESVSMI